MVCDALVHGQTCSCGSTRSPTRGNPLTLNQGWLRAAKGYEHSCGVLGHLGSEDVNELFNLLQQELQKRVWFCIGLLGLYDGSVNGD